MAEQLGKRLNAGRKPMKRPGLHWKITSSVAVDMNAINFHMYML
jgi:hypothetical protein